MKIYFLRKIFHIINDQLSIEERNLLPNDLVARKLFLYIF